MLFSVEKRIMQFKRIGVSGLFISEITFGTALTIGTESKEKEVVQNLVDKAWNLGIRSFDTSNNYGFGQAEVMLGEALISYPRELYVLATKGSWPIGEDVYQRGLGRKHIIWALNQSLLRLNVDYIDVYYAHRYDHNTPIEEVVRTFGQMISSGKILYWATSEWPLDALIECHKVCDRLNVERPILDQFIYSYAINKADTNGIRSFCAENGVGMLGFSPLCQGYLTGKYHDSIPLNSRIAKSEKIGYGKTVNFYNQFSARIDFFNELCKSYDVRGSHAALQWVLKRGVLPVLGASSPAQLDENIAGLQTQIPQEFWMALDSNEI